MRVYVRLPVADRFWPKVDKRGPDECWDWQGATMQGYGILGRTPASPLGPRVPARTAHRVSWELHHGALQPGQIVCHTCDRPICVNPHHLFVGAPADNARDRNSKGRSGSLAGSANPSVKLTPEEVIEIRRRYAAGGATQASLAEEYGVSQAQISRIVRGESYTTT